MCTAARASANRYTADVHVNAFKQGCMLWGEGRGFIFFFKACFYHVFYHVYHACSRGWLPDESGWVLTEVIVVRSRRPNYLTAKIRLNLVT